MTQEEMARWAARLAADVSGMYGGDVIGRATAVILTVLEKVAKESVAALEQDRRARTIPGAPLTPEALEEINKQLAGLNRGSGQFEVMGDVTSGPHSEWRHYIDGPTYADDTLAAGMAEFCNRAPDNMHDLLDHLRFVEGLLRDALAAGELDQWRAGHAAGLEEAAVCARELGYGNVTAFIRSLKSQS